ncbi:MAG TPA: MaoC/PaaZ C-terminal domain-containing protein [bacterium]|nr:MaoC/PaaZ C-terminal domain-containing protein [bacterium]
MAVVLGRPGAWTEAFRYTAEAAQIAAYAAATNETDTRFAAGALASPMYATVPVRPAVRAAFAQAMPEGLPPTVPRLAGEQDMFFHQPIVAGMTVSVRGRFLGIFPKSSGTALVFHFETRSDVDRLLNEQYMTTFLPRVAWPEEAGERPPDHAMPEDIQGRAPLARVVQRFDDDQTYRYSAASGDPSRWHIDNEFARAAGLPGIIIHGLCTMAFVARAVAQTAGDGDLLRLKRLAVRFSRPIYPGSEMVTVIWLGHRNGAGTRLFCEAVGADGAKVITNGLAEVAPPS